MKNQMKLFGIISITAVIVLAIASCGDGGGNPEGGETPFTPPASPEAMSGKTALQYFRDEGITVGMNVGNTLDAYNNWEAPSTWKANETAWGNVKVNQTYITGLKNLGFNIIRIPVTWTGHIGPAPDYKIDETYLQRVAEVVGYAKTAGLKAFINIHHDGHTNTGDPSGWLDINKAVAGDTTVTDKYYNVWVQIAEYFKNYGDWLMFQGFNEIHRGDWGLDGTQAEYNVINTWNQKFTDAVRSTGGNNAKRYLLYYGYMVSHHIAGKDHSKFILPSDGSNGNTRQVVGFHYYQQWEFTIVCSSHTWDTPTARNDIATAFSNFKTNFIDKGIPVIIGENAPFKYANYPGNTGYNAANVSAARQNRLLYIDYMYGEARKNGLVPVYWESGIYEIQYAAEGDASLINRNNGQPNSTESRAVIERMIAAINNATPPTPPNPGEGTAAVITWGNGFADTENGSSITITKNEDELTISGNASGWGAGVFGTPDVSTLTKLKSMTSMTFSVLGDGNSYRVMLPTPETDGSGDHFGKTFSTTNGQKIIITVNISDLAQNGSGAAFIQNNVKGLQFHPVGDGSFNLTVSDIKTYQ